MFLEQAEIHNFRGIRHLKIDFESSSTVLIGENSWGKTSLLRVLWMVLGRGEVLCQFEPKDLYVPVPLFGEDTLKQNDASNVIKRKVQDLLKTKAATQAGAASSFSRAGTELERPVLSFDRQHLSRRQYSLIRHQNYLNYLKKGSNKDALTEEMAAALIAGVFKNKAEQIRISLIFRESDRGGENLAEPLLSSYWNYCADGLYRIHYRVTAKNVEGKFITLHELIDRHGNPYPNVKDESLLYLISKNPVIRLRDRRMNTQQGADGHLEVEHPALTVSPIIDGVALSGQEMNESLLTLNSLLQKYFSTYNSRGPKQDGSMASRNIGDIVNRPISLETLQDLQEDLQSPKFNKTKLLASLLVGQVSRTTEGRKINWSSRPILILEDIESRFHPSLLLSFWAVLEGVKMQKIVTTNSGDLLSALPLSAIRRLQRNYYDTLCYKIGENSLSKDELRRIAFHLRLNRPMTFFARSWLLVEGETEIWMLSEAASLLGVSLQSEGIRPVEFAQCGLHPLIKLARLLGIHFFVLTDGDEAGEKYAQVVRSMLGKTEAEHCLYMVPHVDIEHYLYYNGYAEVFKRCTGSREMLKRGISVDKIIDKAIRHMTKPGLALEVIEEMHKRGNAGVPRLFRAMFNKLNESQLSDIF